MSHELAGHIAVGGIFWSAIGFVIAVSAFWPWWKTQLGWSITVNELALTVAVAPSILVYWFGPAVYTGAPWLFWVSIGALLTIPPAVAWRAAVIWHTQRKARDML